MKLVNCPQEDAVAKAARRSAWRDGLEAHAAECSVCRGIKEASRWMQAFAEPAGERNPQEAALPDAAWIWRSAQWARNQERADRMDAVLEGGNAAVLAAVPAALAVWIAADWQAVEGAAARLLLASWSHLPISAYGIASLAPLALVAAAAALAYPLLDLE